MINKGKFGQTKDGTTVWSYTLSNKNGMKATILTLGGIIQSLTVDGIDVVTGYDTVKGYEDGTCYMGALVGRVGNRIGGGRFTLDGVEYSLPLNNGPNCNHGGLEGFDRRIWDASDDGRVLRLTMTSPDGDQGFPGNLSVEADYELTDDDTLILSYKAETDKATPVNLTSHSYFNLNGTGDIWNHKLRVFSSRVTDSDEYLLPDGQISDITGTPLDFTQSRQIGDSLRHTDYLPLKNGNGIDHNYLFSDDSKNQPVRKMAELTGNSLKLTVSSNRPGLQVYTGNYLEEGPGKQGRVYGKQTGVAFEPQNWPDAVNRPEFPESVLRPGEVYTSQFRYHFDRI
ncbi:MAG: aldose epimerase family protein [Eubacteriaceae bacterium]|jgi:aldose 1-epimerase